MVSTRDESARVRLTARQEALVRALVSDTDVHTRANDLAKTRVTATQTRKTYDGLLSQGFRVGDVEDALRAVCGDTAGFRLVVFERRERAVTATVSNGRTFGVSFGRRRRGGGDGGEWRDGAKARHRGGGCDDEEGGE